MKPVHRPRRRSALLPGLLAAAGALLLVANLGIVSPSRFILPALGILVGIFLAATAGASDTRLGTGLFLIGAFALLLLVRLGFLPGLPTIWPAFLIVAAAAIALARRRKRP